MALSEMRIAHRLVDPGRFLRMFDDVAQIGATASGGVHRLAASAEDATARRWLQARFADLGMRTFVDEIGNMAGLLDIAGPGAPVVMAGSHLDSQPQGGRFDGALGVVAACEAAFALRGATMAKALSPRCNLAVVNWTNEEGARFQPSLLGSAVFAGDLALDTALQLRDPTGVGVGDALAAIGYRGHGVLPHPAAYVELHVECGPELEKAGEHLGVFDRYWGAVKQRVVFVGAQAHTGPTPMADRRDALLGAAYLITALRAMSDQAEGVLHTSIGRIEVSPNSPNVVPAEAVLFVELRSVDPAILEWAEARLQHVAAEAAQKGGVSLGVRATERRPAGAFDAGLTEVCRTEAQAIGFAPRLSATVPGHDAISLSGVCPAAMIVVPSVGGVCHHPAEFTHTDDIVLGADLLTRVLWRLCRDGIAP